MKNEMTYELFELKKLLHNGQTIYTILRSVAPSGMSRVISFHIILDGDILCINAFIHKILGLKFDRKSTGLRVNGCCTNMGYSVIHDLSIALGIDLSHLWL